MAGKKVSKYGEEDWQAILDAYNYQPKLTTKLDAFRGAFTQDTINEIVLWKVNRYAKLAEIMQDLNELKDDAELDVEKTEKVLKEMLAVKGIGLPMASTILRFRNPEVYAIIDDRAYYYVYNTVLRLKTTSSEKSIAYNIKTYIDYLSDIRELCKKRGVAFKDADRAFYQVDKMSKRKIKQQKLA